MRTSEKTEMISAALAKAQGAMKNPAFDRENPHFKSKYATLAAIRNEVLPELAKVGIALTQEVTYHEHGIGIVTSLFHESGQWMATEPIVIPVSKDDAQGVVAASTYGRRVGLSSIGCVVGDDDQDGNDVPKPTTRSPGASSQKRQEAPPAAPAKTGSDFITGFVNALQAASTARQVEDFYAGALKAAEARGSSLKEVESIKPWKALMLARLELPGEDWKRMVELHAGKTGEPLYGFSWETIGKFGADVKHRLERGS